MQRVACVPIRTRLVAVFIVSVLLILYAVPHSAANFEGLCSKTCVVENCDSIGIRYGKYCGVGWTGCHGEKPCDDLDACCKVHDECVEKKGMTNVKCHEKFKRCIKKVHKSGKPGFSKTCTYDTAVPTMTQDTTGAKCTSTEEGYEYSVAAASSQKHGKVCKYIHTYRDILMRAIGKCSPKMPPSGLQYLDG